MLCYVCCQLHFDEMNMSKPLQITFDAVPWCDKMSIPVCTCTPGGKHVFCDPKNMSQGRMSSALTSALANYTTAGEREPWLTNLCYCGLLTWGSRNQFGKHHYIMTVRCMSCSVCSLRCIPVSNRPQFGKANTALQASWSSPCCPQQELNDLQNYQ